VNKSISNPFDEEEWKWISWLVSKHKNLTVLGINQERIIDKISVILEKMEREATLSKKEIKSLAKSKHFADHKETRNKIPPVKQSLKKAKNEANFRLKEKKLSPQTMPAKKTDIFLVMKSGKSAPKIVTDLLITELANCGIISKDILKAWGTKPEQIFSLFCSVKFQAKLRWTENGTDFIYWFENPESRKSITRYLRIFKEGIRKYGRNGSFTFKYVWLKELPGVKEIGE